MFTRCELGKNKTLINNTNVKAIYLYPDSTGDVIIKQLNGLEMRRVQPGNITVDHGYPLSIECTTDKCLISVWVYEQYYLNQFFAVNSAGGIFSLKNETLSEAYSCLFDFGERTRAVFKEIKHTRVGTAVSISYYDEREEKIVQIGYGSTEKASVEFSSPGMLEIRDSIYEPISISAVVGSIVKVKYPFTNHPKTGVAQTSILNSTIDLADKSLLKISNPTNERMFWLVFAMIMAAISAIILISGLVIILATYITHSKRHKYVNRVILSSSSSFNSQKSSDDFPEK